MNAMLFWFLMYTVLTALTAAFIVLLFKKLGWAEWMQVHGDEFSSKLFSCDFCMSFWSAVIVVFVLVGITGDGSLLFIPFCSTPITRILL